MQRLIATSNGISHYVCSPAEGSFVFISHYWRLREHRRRMDRKKCKSEYGEKYCVMFLFVRNMAGRQGNT